MNKFKKISLIILLIIFVLGITTSIAYTVGSSTDAGKMLEKLKAGESLTGISSETRDKNPALYCINRTTVIDPEANYKLTSSTPTVYPNADSTNGHAKAYILAADGYVKSDDDYKHLTVNDERQWAWYVITEPNAGLTKNDLYNIAVEYQNYKKTEKTLILTQGTNAKTFASGENVVYGPVNVEYSYKKASSGSKSDEWGGFNYAFFDENGNNVSDKVKLCILENGSYVEVKSTLISSNDKSNGYYKVRTMDYNGEDLYFVTNDKNLTKINIKIQSNTATYTASVYKLEGSVYKSSADADYCQECRSNSNYATHNGSLWVETKNETKERYANYDLKNYSYFIYPDGETDTVEVGLAKKTTTKRTEYITHGSSYTTPEAAMNSHNFTSDSSNTYRCTICNIGGISNQAAHRQSYQTVVSYKWEQTKRWFKPYGGCGKEIYGYKDGASSYCGLGRQAGYYGSQGLMLVATDSKDEVIEDGYTQDIELLTSIEIVKKWEDFDNYYGERPEDIAIEVYRSTDGKNWSKLNQNTTQNETADNQYKISNWTKNANTWTKVITELKRTDSSGKQYYFKVVESTTPNYYEVIYKDNNGIIDIESAEKTVTITNRLKYTQIDIEKVWDDDNNSHGTRPNNIGIRVYRCVAEDYPNWSSMTWDNVNWEGPLVEGTDYTITWTNKNTNNWKATISNLEIANSDRELYYFKIVEVADGNTTVKYVSTTKDGTAQDNYVRVNAIDKAITITNELKLIDISVTKEWEDFGDFNGVRPNDIDLIVYRSTNNRNWEKLTKGKDYKNITWSKGKNNIWTGEKSNTWTATISGLLERDKKGNPYYFKVEEGNQVFHNVTYLSGSNTDGKVDNNTITIKNEIKYVDLEITKIWNDYNNEYGLRPNSIDFNVFRSTDQRNWTKLTKGKDYEVTWETTQGNTWKGTISKLLGVDKNGKSYYFKVEEQALVYYDAKYPQGQIKQYNVNNAQHKEFITIENNLKHINISGYVWLDGQTGIKPATTNDGIMGDSEEKLANVVVHLFYKQPKTKGGKTVEVAQTVTDKNGYYEFKDFEIGYYYVEFDYDGVHYEDTIKVENSNTQKVSKAFENDSERNAFNSRFTTISYKKSNDGTTLNYDYINKKSTLITTNQDGTVTANFEMNARTPNELLKTNTENHNLGLVKRGTDIALSTDVSDAQVFINGQTTDYKYNTGDDNIPIGTTQTSETVSYNLKLYESDYNYRIRDYISNEAFTEKDYINSENPTGLKTGDDLKVYVEYELNLQNQSTETTRINEVKYSYDEKYTFKEIVGGGYAVTDNGNTVTINLNGLSLAEGETKTLKLKFKVKDNNGLSTGEFSNKAEITSYSTDKGLIDIDSQPGNFIADNQVEDDCDKAGGLTISVPGSHARKITGKVFDNSNSQSPVNDVIVQLIELKQHNGKMYEYIWQETVSGPEVGKDTRTGKKMSMSGTSLENYTYTSSNGYYEFNGFIPGDYIVRFIYGDGTTYDLTGNVIKYNGQDYKSMADSNYRAEWYNTSSAGASVARDNEARRLETMSYSVEIDAKKGLLLKLLNNVTPSTLNETEKETLKIVYKEVYGTEVTEITQEVINKILKEQTLKNTWMCAETSKIKVAVDTENIANTNSTTNVNGIGTTYVNNISNINLGLEKRPETKIELKKYITSFKLVAANGQTLVNAYVDINEYLNGTADISNKVQGIRDNLTVLGNVWQYEVAPTDINTVVDGANLEFQYTLVVENKGETDYLSAELSNAYNNSSITEYKTLLTQKIDVIKSAVRTSGYNTIIGGSVGANYYTGNKNGEVVKTEITNIRDYVNTDLNPVYTGDVELDQDALNEQTAGVRTYRMLDDKYALQKVTLNTILKTTRATGKMTPEDNEQMYTVTLSKNPISSTGNLSFDTYIAEIVSYTNAAGRRAVVSTPGNAEIIDAEKRDGKAHEIDEADTGRIQIVAATGEDLTINYIIIIAVASGIALVALGAYVVKKYVIK